MTQEYEVIDMSTVRLIKDPAGSTFIGYKTIDGKAETVRISFEDMKAIFGLTDQTGNDATKVINQKALTQFLANKADTTNADGTLVRTLDGKIPTVDVSGLATKKNAQGYEVVYGKDGKVSESELSSDFKKSIQDTAKTANEAKATANQAIEAIGDLETSLENGFFNISGFVEKGNGKIIYDASYLKASIFLKIKGSDDIVITGYSGLNDSAALCGCYDKNKKFLGSINATSQGWVNKYKISLNSLPVGSYYVRFSRLSTQSIYIEGVELIMSDRDTQEFYESDLTKINDEKTTFENKFVSDFFNIQGFVEKGNGKIITDTYLRASIFLKVISNTDITVSGYSGLNDSAGLCVCYDKNKKFLGVIQAPTNGVVNRYVISFNSLLPNTYYVRFSRTNLQEIYVKGVETIMSSKDIQQFHENDINVINNDRTYINSGYFDIVGYIHKNNGLRGIQDDFRCTRYLKVIPDTDITISGYSGLNDSAGLCVCYDENCNYIDVIQSPTNGVVYDYTISYSSLPTNTYYIRCTGTKPQYNRYVKGVETRGDFNTPLAIVDKTQRTLDIKIQENSFYPDFVKVRNYIGNYQNIHPKVLYFENGLFGYKYWMGYTPFPYATEMYENPCIAVSQNGIDWTVPKGLHNPLAYAPNNGYNSDTHLVYREDTSTLELWYRPYDKTTSKGRLVRRTTTNGINWTPETVVSNIEGVLSPSIIFEDGKYKLWYPTNRKLIAYTESADDTASNWTTPIETILPNITVWHMDVIKTNNGIEFLIQGWEDGGGDNNHSQLYYAIEKNGVMSKPVRIADKTLLPEPPENYRGLYRSSFVLINGVYSLYYSFIKKDWEQGMFLAQGADILHLNPYNREINRRNNILVIDQDTVMSDYYIHSANTIHIKDCIVTLKSFTNAIPNSIVTIVVSGDDGVCMVNTSDRIIGQNKTITTNGSCRILATSANVGILIN